MLSDIDLTGRRFSRLFLFATAVVVFALAATHCWSARSFLGTRTLLVMPVSIAKSSRANL